MPQYISILLDENEILRWGDILIFQDSNCCGAGPKIGPHQAIVQSWAGNRLCSLWRWINNCTYSEYEFTSCIIAAVRLYSFDEIDYHD